MEQETNSVIQMTETEQKHICEIGHRFVHQDKTHLQAKSMFTTKI